MKEGEDRTFVIVDAAMNDQIRPTLYDAHHRRSRPRDRCRGHRLRRRRPGLRDGRFPRPQRPPARLSPGDLLAVYSAGLQALSSTYLRLLVAEVLVTGRAWPSCARARTYEDLIGMDRLPDWLA